MRTFAICRASNSSLALVLLVSLLCACSNEDVSADTRSETVSTDDTGSETGDTDTEESGETGDGDGDGDDCPPGTLHCPCDVGSTCEASLMCVEGVCQAGSSGSCGDGIVDPGEECDDGNDSNTDTCLNDCSAASCGDGFVGPGEGCDDGNDVDDDECTNACAFASCGDGMVQTGEVCDDGNADNSDDCLDTCVDASCGDGVVQVGAEECDDGNIDNSDSCVSECKNATCGDGYVGPGEGCDDGNQIADDECTNSCKSPNCGDGIVDPDEDCDDGNDVESDDCLSTCVAASCGDSFVQAGVEGCDDGNGVDSDACLSSCESAGCGDGYVWEGNEGCDDGNGVDSDACLSTCVSASCGDGFVWAGNETCDDGNLIANDGCELSCSVSMGVKKVVLGSSHTCILTWTGQVKCWGYNVHGQLGYGNTDPLLDGDTPASLGWVDIGGQAIDLAAGGSHSCALLDDHSVVCWGYNLHGQCGYGHTNHIGDNELPASVGAINLGGDVAEVALGGTYSCALMFDGAVRCWGYGPGGALGYGDTQWIGDNESAGAGGNVDVGGGPIAQLAVGGVHNCVLTEAGEIRCWGRNIYGQLGYGHINDIGDNELPSSAGVVNVGPGTVVEVQAGKYHTCVRFDDDTIKCWGANFYGELGYGNLTTIGNDETPASIGVVNTGGPVTQVVALGDETCALYDGGSVRCWGRGQWGRLGYASENNIGDNELPASVGFVNIGVPVVAFADGSADSHVCVITETGGVRCWGENNARKLGYGHLLSIGDDEFPSSAGDVQIE